MGGSVRSSWRTVPFVKMACPPWVTITRAEAARHEDLTGESRWVGRIKGSPELSVLVHASGVSSSQKVFVIRRATLMFKAIPRGVYMYPIRGR